MVVDRFYLYTRGIIFIYFLRVFRFYNKVKVTLYYIMFDLRFLRGFFVRKGLVEVV